MSAVTVWELPCKSQEFNQGPKIRQEAGDQLVLAYDFEQESGDYGWEELIFTGVAAFTYTAATHCSEEQIGAYDKLQDLGVTDSVAAVVNRSPGLRHFRIYFDDVGCYEVLASGFIPPAET